MGVPGLFSFLNRRYPQITRPAEHKRDQQTGAHDPTDNLYIDMNHIIHSCTHSRVTKDRPKISQAEMFAGMATYLDSLMDLLEPRRVVVIAVDGVAPRAKMNQQRTRRFLSAYLSNVNECTERDIRREMQSEAGGNLHIPDLRHFDSNIITPGAEFMLALASWLREWAGQKVASDTRFAHTAFVISDAAEPGEGEHKIMKFIRHLKVQPGYDPNTQHVVFGQDADLLLLTLLTHEPYIKLVREDMQARTPSVKEARQAERAKEAEAAKQQQLLIQQQQLSAVQAALIQQQQQQQQQIAVTPLPSIDYINTPQVSAPSSDHLNMPMFEVVDVRILRECLQWEFSDLVGPPGPPGMYGSDVDSHDTESDSESNNSSDNDVQSEHSESDHVVAGSSSESAGSAVKATADSIKDKLSASGADESVQASRSTPPAAEYGANKELKQRNNSEATSSTAVGQVAAAVGEHKGAAEDVDTGDESDDSLEDLLGLAVGKSKRTAAATAAMVSEAEAADAQALTVLTSKPEDSQGLQAAPRLQLSASGGKEEVQSAAGSLAAEASNAAPASPLLPPSVAAECTHSSNSNTSPAMQINAVPVASEAPYVGVSPASVRSMDAASTTAAAASIRLTSSTRGSRPGSSSSNSKSNQTLRPPKQRGRSGLNFENLLDDLVVLTFLAGNDFLPNVPSIDIYDKPTGLDLLFVAYKHLLPELGGHLTAGGVINRSRLVQLLVFLARDEEAAYKRRADFRRKRARERSAEQAAAEAEVAALFDGGLSVGELPDGVDVDQLMAGLAPGVADALGLSNRSAQPAVNLTTMTPGQLCEELSNRTLARAKDRVMGGDPWAQDPIQMDLPKYRERYYQARFPELFQQCEGDIDKIAARVSWEYLQGMNWVLKYYAAGPAAIHWQQEGEQQQQVDQDDTVQVNVKDDSNSSSSGSSDVEDAADTSSVGSQQHQQQQQDDDEGNAMSSAAVEDAAAAAADVQESDDDSLMALLTGPTELKSAQNQQQEQQQQPTEKLAPAGASTAGEPLAKNKLQQKQKRIPSRRSKHNGKQKTSIAAASGLDGASWTWCYPYHYAPLLQDLSKVKLWQKNASRKQPITVGLVPVSRQLSSPHCCPLRHWAPPGGPVRPLLQLMCVLPAKSAAEALPENLANLIAIAESMDVSEVTATNSQQQQGSSNDGNSQQKSERPAGPAATCFQALELAVDGLLAGDDAMNNKAHVTSDVYPPESSISQMFLNPGSEAHQLLGLELTGDMDTDLLRLAEALSAMFPNDVTPLVDLTGKKWLHTGIVRLPMADPRKLAAALQAVLAMQCDGDHGDAAGGLSETELLGNSFRPALVIAAAPAPAADSASSTEPASIANSNSRSDIWSRFTKTAATDGSSKRDSSSGGGSLAAVPVVPVAAAASLGALGALLGQRGALHTLPTNTLQHLPASKSRQQQQQQQQDVATWEGSVDIAGLPVPEHNCCLLTGTTPPELTVTPSIWRHMAAGLTYTISHAERVLGVRSNGSYAGSSNRSGLGGSEQGRGLRGGRRGRGGWEGRGRGGGNGSCGAVLAPYGRQVQQQQPCLSQRCTMYLVARYSMLEEGTAVVVGSMAGGITAAGGSTELHLSHLLHIANSSLSSYLKYREAYLLSTISGEGTWGNFCQVAVTA